MRYGSVDRCDRGHLYTFLLYYFNEERIIFTSFHKGKIYLYVILVYSFHVDCNVDVGGRKAVGFNDYFTGAPIYYLHAIRSSASANPPIFKRTYFLLDEYCSILFNIFSPLRWEKTFVLNTITRSYKIWYLMTITKKSVLFSRDIRLSINVTEYNCVMISNIARIALKINSYENRQNSG